MVRIVRATKKRLGEILMDAGLLSVDEVNKIINEQKQTGEKFGDILIAKGIVSAEDIVLAIVTQFRLPFVHLSQLDIGASMKGIFPEGLLRKHSFVPFDKLGDVLLIATSGPIDVEVLEELESMSQCHIRVFVATDPEVKKAIGDHFVEERKASELASMLNLELS
jgi:type IV pilus assembly protein PilB